jgi:hypothetical protein
MAVHAEQYPDLKDRPVHETICLFDVDGTLTPARQRVSPEMLRLLSELRHKCAIGFVGHALFIFTPSNLEARVQVSVKLATCLFKPKSEPLYFIYIRL